MKLKVDTREYREQFSRGPVGIDCWTFLVEKRDGSKKTIAERGEYSKVQRRILRAEGPAAKAIILCTRQERKTEK